MTYCCHSHDGHVWPPQFQTHWPTAFNNATVASNRERADNANLCIVQQSTAVNLGYGSAHTANHQLLQIPYHLFLQLLFTQDME